MGHIPSPLGLAFSLPLQLCILAILGVATARDLGQDHRWRVAKRIIIGGLVAGVLIRVTVLLVAGDVAHANACRRHYGSQLPDSFWIVAEFVETGLLAWGGLGIILAWLAARFWARGIRADKTTVFIGGLILGALAGVALELAHIHWGHVSSIGGARIAFFTSAGGLLSLICKPFLFRNGRFQFGIKSLLAITAIWALLLGLVCPQFSRYQEEEDTLAAIATILGQPVQCERVEGLSGVAHVDYVFLSKCTLTEDQVDAIVPELRRLRSLRDVDVSSVIMTDSCRKRLRDALPTVGIGSVCTSGSKEEILPVVNKSGN
jgi:hypothetical protein